MSAAKRRKAAAGPAITCYRIRDRAPEIVPGRATRDWMDNTNQRFAYRCLPLSIANGMGWEVVSPVRLTAVWNGKQDLDAIDVKVDSDDEYWHGHRLASSHFGHGILTFQTGHLFRTPPGIGLWARGAPNWPKDGIWPLDGIIETDWLAFTFTMNWQFTRPGEVVFEKDEPFCFITPIAYRGLEDVVPEIRPIGEDEELARQNKVWSDARSDFNRKLAEGDPDTIRLGWQKWYMRGVSPEGGGGSNPDHLGKLRLAQPVWRGKDDAGER